MSLEKPGRVGLSGCVISFNEADRIGECLRSMDFCDELVVVDSHSTDGTRETAAALGARVIERDWPGHVAQKEFAVRQAAWEWVLCLDADERVSPRLRDEILALRDAGFPGFAGWSMCRLSFYLGAWVRYGTWYPNRQLRLFDRRRGRWAGYDPHDRVELDGRAGRLAGDLHHYPYRTLDEHVGRMNRYTTTMAEGLFRRGKRASWLRLFGNPAGRFLRSYILKAGFLDGWRGLLIAVLAAHYVQLKYLKLLAMRRGEGGGGDRQ